MSKERRMDCLERCMRDLDEESREIIIQYYRGDGRAKIENRRALARAHETMLVVFINAIKQQQQQIDLLKKIVCADHPDAEVCRPAR